MLVRFSHTYNTYLSSAVQLVEKECISPGSLLNEKLSESWPTLILEGVRKLWPMGTLPLTPHAGPTITDLKICG